jgi:hypothetical protein
VRMIPGDDLDERRASRARMPVGVGQAQHLTQPQAFSPGRLAVA